MTVAVFTTRLFKYSHFTDKINTKYICIYAILREIVFMAIETIDKKIPINKPTIEELF